MLKPLPFHMFCLLLPLTLAAAGAQAAPLSVLKPVEARIRTIVLHAQPHATFATAPNILIGQYKTANHVFARHAVGGQKVSPLVELGPLPGGGFYLQLDVMKTQGKAAVQIARPNPSQPWTSVISTYPLAHSPQMIVMTWEATSGAPRGLAEHLRATLIHYAAQAH